MSITVYIDESGDHSLTSIDPSYPVFVLVLFVVTTDDYCNVLVPKVYKLKHDYFGHECVPLHSIDIRKKRHAFGFLNDAGKHADFMSRISDLMATGYTLIACAIKKQEHFNRYGSNADNPYHFALEMAIERLLPHVEQAGETEVHMFAESRGFKEDKMLRDTFDRIVTYGNNYISADRIKAIRLHLSFKSKYANIIGMELADLAAYPIGRYVLDRNKPNPAYDVVKGRFYRGAGGISGLKIFP